MRTEFKKPNLTGFIREIDVLKQWPMSKATLIRARKNGLPFFRLGAFVCYRPEDLEAHFCKELSWKLGQVGTKKKRDGSLVAKGKEGNRNGQM